MLEQESEHQDDVGQVAADLGDGHQGVAESQPGVAGGVLRRVPGLVAGLADRRQGGGAVHVGRG